MEKQPMNNVFKILLLDKFSNFGSLIESELNLSDLRINLVEVKSKEEFLTSIEYYSPDLIIIYKTGSEINMKALKEFAKTRNPNCVFILIEGIANEQFTIELSRNGCISDKTTGSADNINLAMKHLIERAYTLINDGTNHIVSAVSPPDDEPELIHGPVLEKFEEAFEGIAIIDKLGKPVKVNKTFMELVAYDNEVPNINDWIDFVVIEDKNAALAAFERMHSLGKAKAEYRVRVRNSKPIDVKAVMIKNSDTYGKYTGFYLFIEDVTGQKKYERMLEYAQSFTEAAMNSIDSQIAIIDSDGSVLSVNRAWNAYLFSNNYEMRNFVPGTHYLRFLKSYFRRDLGNAAKLSKAIQEVLEGMSHVHRIEYTIQKPGDLRWYLSKVTSFTADGSFKAVLMIDDITQVKRDKSRLAESEQEFRSLVQNSSDMMTILEADGTIRYISPSVERILGYKPEERIGRNFLELAHPDDIEKHKESLVNAWKSPNEIVSILHRRRKKDGTYLHMESIANNLLLDPIVKGIVINSRDITERKNYETNMSNALMEKEVLLKEIHHRVKNNLQIVSSLLSIQEKHIDNNEFKSVFRESINRINTMALLHKNLYKSKTFSEISMPEYLRSITEYLLSLYGAREKGIECRIETDDANLNIETAIPCGLILNELVSNALRHAFSCCKSGNLIVKFESNHKCILTISDDGTGIPEHVNSEKPKTLGLEIVTALSEQLNADLEIIRNNGTTFKITFENLNYQNRIG